MLGLSSIYYIIVSFAPEAKKTHIHTVINLYKDKRIPNMKTTVNAITLLSSSKKNQKEKARNTFRGIIKKPLIMVENNKGSQEADRTK